MFATRITQTGLDLISKSIDESTPLTFTKIALGGGIGVDTIVSLQHHINNLVVTSEVDHWNVYGRVNGEGLVNDLSITEVALYAKVGSGEEAVLSYGTQLRPDILKAKSIDYFGFRFLINPLETEHITVELRQGEDGLSAFEVAKKNGFEGTQEDWLESLKGTQGIQGPKGEAGTQGIQGIQGPKGEQGLTGDKGDTGPEGKMPDVSDIRAELAARPPVLFLTQAQYDALAEKELATVYIIHEGVEL